MSIEEQRQSFETFCLERYGGENGCPKSKVITREKGDRVIKVLQNDPAAVHDVKFKFWVKQRGFSLMNYAPLGLKDVLCLPAKEQVIYNCW